MDDDGLLGVLHDVVDAVRAALGGIDDWGLAGTEDRHDQYLSDLAADAAAVALLDRAGLGVLSEESGLHAPDRAVLVVLDPVDGSTNASLGLPWYATSLCALDAEGARAAVVADHASGIRYEAVRGGGARAGGRPLRPSACTRVGEAVVGLTDWPSAHLGWMQYRAFHAAALDLCAVAGGRLDGYVDCGVDLHGPWDYLGGMLICQEAGAVVVDAHGRDLVVRDHGARRTPVAAATPALLDELLAARAHLDRPAA